MIPKKAFTLIELVVVVAVIVLQLAIIMPLLGASREQALEAVCLSNQKQLSLAWTCYYNDNDGLLVGGSNYYSGTRATPYRWVEYPLYHDTDNPEINVRPPDVQYSREFRLNGIRAGKLYAYTGDESLYHCPSDNNITQAEPFSIFRSYAIAGLMNGEDFISRVSGLYSPISQYRSAVTSPGGAMKPLVVAVNFSDITTPSSKYVFVEEDVSQKGQNVNNGGFVLLPGIHYNWWDWPASFHTGKSTFGFADGHAQIQHWQDPDTLNLIQTGTPDPDPYRNKDLEWLVNGYLPVTP
jgi:prepilin-type N-terminal cleavage/methylation domain-containing protein/prepilin-type processing-associated H-X9-DG protein